MIGAFQFEDNGKTYKCRVEEPRAPRTGSWWWFDVSGDGHRYAPFQALTSDTQASVRSRIVTYYSNHITLRTMPAVARQHWAQRRKDAAAAAPVSPPAT